MSDQELVPVGPGRDDGAEEPDAAGPQAAEPESGSDVETVGSEAVAELDVEITPEDGADVRVDPDDGVGSASVTDIEALLFVAERPLSRAELRTVARLSADEVDERLGNLEVQLRERGIRLITSGDRVMLGTSPESGQLIARYLGADAVRLSPAALETLAIVAYRQPVTRGVIERIRGVDSGHVVRGLLHRRLIHEQGRAETPGRPILYGTSMEFMERFGLTSLDDLPPLEAEIAAQLAQAETEAKPEVGTGAEAGTPIEASTAPEAGTGSPAAEDDPNASEPAADRVEATAPEEETPPRDG